MQTNVFAGKKQNKTKETKTTKNQNHKWLCDSCIPHFKRKYISF